MAANMKYFYEIGVGESNFGNVIIFDGIDKVHPTVITAL